MTTKRNQLIEHHPSSITEDDPFPNFARGSPDREPEYWSAAC